MHNYLSYDDFLSELILYKKPTVIVESLTDVNLMDNLFNMKKIHSSSVNIISPEIRGLNRKGMVIKAIEDINYDLSEKKRKKFLGIVDSDFNRICNTCRKDLPNLFYTDKHDIESQIFSSKAFKKFINFTFKNPENLNIEDIRKICLEISKAYGLYLLCFFKSHLHTIKNEILPIDEYFDNKLIFVHNQLKKDLILLDKEGKITTSELTKIMDCLLSNSGKKIDPYQIANGHDLIRVLAILTLWEIKNLKKLGLSNNYRKRLLKMPNERIYLIKELENLLRLSYEFTFFTDSQLYKSIIKYQDKNGLKLIEN